MTTTCKDTQTKAVLSEQWHSNSSAAFNAWNGNLALAAKLNLTDLFCVTCEIFYIETKKIQMRRIDLLCKRKFEFTISEGIK